MSGAAHAQSVVQPAPSREQPAIDDQATPAVTTPDATVPKRDPKAFARFDALREPGLTSRFPGIIDTITGDLGGYRSWLADRNIGFEFQLATIANTSLLDTGQPRSPQVYNGQRPTLQTHALTTTATIGLDAIGLDHSKLIVAGGYIFTSFRPNGPNTATFRGLTYYQSFFDKKLEIKTGFNLNFLEFVGLFAGGNPTLTTGLSSTIPVQVGLSAGQTPTPTFNVTLNGKQGRYAKFAVQRSLSPRGTVDEVERNGIGLKFAIPGAKALYIGELGIKRPSGLGGQRSLWLRGGAIYNQSDYTRFAGGFADNYALYLLGDYQATQPDPVRPYRGLYIGGSALGAPQNVNVYTRSFEARAYYVGPIASRPTDATNVSITYNKFSDAAHTANALLGAGTERYQLSGSVGYSLHAGSGIYILPSLQYIHHPTLRRGYNDALLTTISAFLLF